MSEYEGKYLPSAADVVEQSSRRKRSAPKSESEHKSTFKKVADDQSSPRKEPEKLEIDRIEPAAKSNERAEMTDFCLVRQNTFNKDEARSTSGTQFYIPAENDSSGNVPIPSRILKRLMARRKGGTNRSDTTGDGSRPELRRQNTFTVEKKPPTGLKAEQNGDKDCQKDTLQGAIVQLQMELNEERNLTRSLRHNYEAARSKDKARTRAALHDLQARLASTREALNAEKEGLHRKLNTEFRRALRERESSWRAERDRLECEVRSLRRQLDAAKVQSQRAASAAETEMRRVFQVHIADLAKQKELLQSQVNSKERPSRAPSPANAELRRMLHDREEEARRERQDARRRQAELEQQLKEARAQLHQKEARQSQRLVTEAALARALHEKDREYRNALHEARQRQDDLESQLKEARRVSSRLERERFILNQPSAAAETLALETHRRKHTGSPLATENQQEEQDKRTRRMRKRRRTEKDDDKHETEHNEQRLRLIREEDSLRQTISTLKEAYCCSLPRRYRHNSRKHLQVRRLKQCMQGAVKRLVETNCKESGPSIHANACIARERVSKPMRYFHRLIPLEPVSEVDEQSSAVAALGALGGLGTLGGLGSPVGLAGSVPESPLSSGPSSLSPTPGIGDVWNDLAGGSDQQTALYWQLMRDHLELQRAFQQLEARLAERPERQVRAKLEAQVLDLKRALAKRQCSPTSCSSCGSGALSDALQDVVELRAREQALAGEVAELRDQNELLEFRLLELEGVADKSSVCSGSPDTRDVCTDTDSDTLTEDSGLLSLGASEDGNSASPDSSRTTSISECAEAAVRDRLSHLAGSLQAEEDRGCLQRALQLLNSYQRQLKGPASEPPTPQTQRIIATVLPFTEADDADTDQIISTRSSRDDFRRKQEFFNQIQENGECRKNPFCSRTKSPGDAVTKPGQASRGKSGGLEDGDVATPRKLLKHADCQESGIFDGDLEYSCVELTNTATQTEPGWTCSCSLDSDLEAPFSSLPALVPQKSISSTGSLTAEIKKLSQIRERFEEQSHVNKPLAVNPVQLRELEFLRKRAAQLEDKLSELERSSNPDVRGCARLLEKVAALERQAKEAREAADALVMRNRDLEEERCELEEAENDTRLRCQQLEVEVISLREREGALEVELGRARRSLKAAHELQGRLEVALQSVETRNFELEEATCELRASIAAIETALPAIIAFHLTKYRSYLERELNALRPISNRTLPSPPEKCQEQSPDNHEEVLKRLSQLVEAEHEMQQKIAFLEHKESAFQETLAAADGLWSDMELNYKRQLSRSEEAEEELRQQLRRLEESEASLRLALQQQTEQDDHALLTDRVLELENQKKTMMSRVRALEAEKRSIAEEADRYHEEMLTWKRALDILQARVDGPLQEELSQERRQKQDLAEQLRLLESQTNTEIAALKSQIAVSEKTILDMDVTCGELREEVDTLEEAVCTLRGLLSAAHEKAERELFNMETLLADRDQQLDELRRAENDRALPSALEEMTASLAEEDEESSVSLFRKSLQAFRNSEMAAATNARACKPYKPVPKRESNTVTPIAEDNMSSRKIPPPLPPKNLAVKKAIASATLTLQAGR